MSSLEVVSFISKEFSFLYRKVQSAYIGPTMRSFGAFTSSTGNSTNSIQIACPTTSKEVVTRRNILMYYCLDVAFTGTPIGPPGGTAFSLFQSVSGDCPRSMPMAQNYLNCSVNLDDIPIVAANSGMYIDAMSRYFKDVQRRNLEMSTFPSYPDPLGAGFTTNPQFNVNPGTYNAFTGTAKDPMINGDQGRDHRGDYPFNLSPLNFPTNAGGQTQHAQFVSVEPLLGLSVMSQTSSSQDDGFFGIANITIAITLKSPLNVWSHDCSKLPGVTSSTTFYAAPIALLEFWTPPKHLKPQLPLYYGYTQITPYQQQTTNSVTKNGGLATVNFATTQLNSVPQAVLVFCRVTPGQQLSSITEETAGSINAMDNYAGAPYAAYGSLSGPTRDQGTITVTFENAPGQLSQLSLQQLYGTQVENGLVSTSFSEWLQHGFIIKLFIGKDIYIQTEDVVAGSKGSYNFQISVKYQNNFNHDVTFDPYLITLQEGHITIGQQTNTLDTGSITADMVRNPIATIDLNKKEGGGLFGSILGNLTALIPFTSPFSGVARTIGNVADAAYQYGNKLVGGNVYQPPLKMLKGMGGRTIG